MNKNLFKIKSNFNITINNNELTPIEKHNDFYIKRDDLYSFSNVSGGKARSAKHLIEIAKSKHMGVVTAGVRQSPQIEIVSTIANALNVPCRVHTIRGSLTSETAIAVQNGAKLIVHEDTWHNNVIIARSKIDAINNNYYYIPFGMECKEAVQQTLLQVKNVPDNINRIVIPIGSGMSCAGVLWGIKLFNKHCKVLGIQVGTDPIKRLNTYAPLDWRNNLTIIKSSLSYHQEVNNNYIESLIVDPIYEAKCLPYLNKNDLFWIIGIRKRLNHLN